MSDVDLAVTRLQTEEGFRGTAYRDIVGKLTIGYGFNVDAGISKFAAGELMRAQVAEIRQQLTAYTWWPEGDDTRCSVFLDLAFNMGVGGLLHFPHMLACAEAKDWPGAADALLDSQAARMLPTRYKALGDLLR